jgi:hypothetical protein
VDSQGIGLDARVSRRDKGYHSSGLFERGFGQADIYSGKLVNMLEERKKRVRDLYFIEGMTTRDIARTERISIRDISAIIKEEVKKQNLEDNSQKQLEGRLSANAYRLFDGGMTPVLVSFLESHK